MKYVIFHVTEPGKIVTAGKVQAANVPAALEAFFARKRITEHEAQRRYFARRAGAEASLYQRHPQPRRERAKPSTFLVTLSGPEKRALELTVRERVETADEGHAKPLRRALDKLATAGAA